jgi:hypothetical protein
LLYGNIRATGFYLLASRHQPFTGASSAWCHVVPLGVT